MLVALACFTVLILVLRALRLNILIGAVVAAAGTIALKPYFAMVPVDWRLGLALGIVTAFALLPDLLARIGSRASSRVSGALQLELIDPAVYRARSAPSVVARNAAASVMTMWQEVLASLRMVRLQPSGGEAQLLLLDAGMVTVRAASPGAARARPTLSWAGIAAIGLAAAWFAGADTRRASALQPAPTASLVPAHFEVPNDFPGAVRALEQLAGTRAGSLIVRDSLGASVKASGAVVAVRNELADSLLADAQQFFLQRGFFLFRHESNYGLEGRPDVLALVPIWDQYRVVKVVGTSGADSGTANVDVVAWLRALAPETPFVLTGIGSDYVAGRFTGRLADPAAMARRLHAFCPDVVDQGTGSVADLAAELRRTNAFSCWWDRAR